MCIRDSSSIERAFGSDFADVLTGNDENNLLSGFAGDDVLDGGAGNDIVRGGEGADTLIGGDGIDTADYRDSAAGVSIDLATGAASGGDADGDTLSSIERAFGSDFADVLTGDDENNLLYGYAGDDVLNGGAGNDILRGGEGQDNFVFTTSSGRDRILDFNIGEDLIDLTDFGFNTFSEIEALLSEEDGSVIIQLSDTDSIHLDGVEIDDLSFVDFNF